MTEAANPPAGGDPPTVSPFMPRAHHLLTLEFGDRSSFDDPRLEWRRLFSELLGTFALVLVAAGGGLLHGEGQITLAAAVVAPGLMVMAIILFMGAISGAHLNPAVSLAFALRGDFPWKRVPGYIIIQLIGATLACLFLLAVFGNVRAPRRDAPGPGLRELAGAADGDRPHRAPGQRDPRDRVGGPERRGDRRARRRRLHRAGRPVVGARQRHLDEPGAVVRAGARQRRLRRATGSTSRGRWPGR